MPDFLLQNTSTGELEIVTGTTPFIVTPAAGVGPYNVFLLGTAATVTVTLVDTVAPVLSNVLGAATGADVSLTFDTNEANGTIYNVLTASATQPSAAQIIAGQDHTGAAAVASGSQAVTATGAQTQVDYTGLAEATYYFHLVHQDAALNNSAVASSLALTVDLAPVISGFTWDDTAGLATFTVDEVGPHTFYVATLNSANGTPTATGTGWAGPTLEEFSQSVTNGTNSFSFTETAASATADSFAYYVVDAAGNFLDAQVQPYTHDITGPTLVGSSPADNAIDVPQDSNIILQFDEPVQAGAGNFVIHNAAGVLQTVPGGSTSIAGNDATIDPAADFADGAAIHVLWDEGALEDLRGNPIAANADPTLVNFTVVAGGGAPAHLDIADRADSQLDTDARYDPGYDNADDANVISNQIVFSPRTNFGFAEPNVVISAALTGDQFNSLTVENDQSVNNQSELHIGVRVNTTPTTIAEGYWISYLIDGTTGDGSLALRTNRFSAASNLATATFAEISTTTGGSVDLSTLRSGTQHVFTIEAAGTTIRALVNGFEIFNVTDATYASGGAGYAAYLQAPDPQSGHVFSRSEAGNV